MSVKLRPCGLQGWAVCEGNCEECGTTATTTTDGFWYHGNGKIGGEFHPTKPNDEERYGEYVKVKHGHWIIGGGWANSKGVFTEYKCSVCGDTAIVAFKECPHCKARMDEVEE